MTDPNFRALCAELVDDLELSDWPYKLKEAFRADIERARAALAQPEPVAAPSAVCTGCGTPRHEAISVIAAGSIACCPDCSTLTVEDRNTIRNLAALTHPEPVAPTDEELDELWAEIDGGGAIWAWQDFARAALARWGRPTSEENFE